MPLFDAHVHFFSRRFLDLLYGGGSRGPLDARLVEAGWDLPPEQPEQLAARWVSELDRHGVDRAVLLASLPGDEDSVETAVAAYPQRFSGFFFVNPLADGAAANVRDRLDRGLLRAPCLFPAMHRYSLASEPVTAILDAVREAGAARLVFVHCGVLSVGIRRRLGLPSPFDLRFTNPVDLHAPALRYPELRFIVPHFGAGYFREALMLASLCPNVYLDTSSSNDWMRFEGLTLEAVFRRAAAVAGPQRLLFGTDSSFFPRGWNRTVWEQQAEAMHAAGFSAEQQALVLGGNLLSLLGES